MLKTVLSIFLYFLYHLNSFADLQISKLPAQPNASLNLIYDMYQDSKGFIWMGTMFGLVRYDGREFKNFRYNPNNINSISGDDVVSVMEDSDGNIWTGSFKSGVNKYNPETGIFKRITENTNYSNITFWSICEIKNKIFFGSDRGLFVYENSEFKKIDISPFSDNPVSSLATDGINLWIGTFQKGLIRTNTDLNNFTVYNYDSTSENSINGSSITSIQFHKHRLYIGFNMNGLGYFENLNSDSIKYKKISMLDTVNLNNLTVNSLSSDKNEKLFIGTTSGGFLVNTSNNNLININSRLKEENIFKIFNSGIFDKSGVLWLGSYYNGLYKVTDEIKNFYSLPYNQFINNRALHQDKNNNLWISSNRFLYHYTGDLVFFDTLKLKTIFNKFVNTIVEFNDKIWVGSGSGIATFDFEGKAIDYEIKINNKLPFVNKFFVANENELYIATNIGLFITDGKVIKEIPLDLDLSPFDKSVISVFKDSHNNIYAGTFNGLYFSDDGINFKKYSKSSGLDSSLSNNYIYSFFEKSENEIMLGTAAGINIFDQKTKKIKLIENNTLLKKVILSINKIGNQYWFNTNSGICKYEFETNTLIQYNSSNGLNDDYYFPSSAIITDNGYYMGGGQTEITYFRPNMIIESSYKPEIIFSYIKISGKDSSYNKNINSDRIVLEQNENNFELVYSSTDFNNPENIEYSYRINNGVWEKPGNINKIFFTNLSPGEYKIDLICTNSDGVSNNLIFSKIFIVKPPFYKTSLFYFAVFASVILISFLFYKFRIDQKIKYILDIERAKESERESFRKQAAKDYHDELGHKLTRILLYTRNINKKINAGNESDVINELKNIEETSLSLKNSARDLIWSMNPVEDTVYDLALRVKDFAEEILEPANIKFHLQMDDSELKYIDLPVIVKRNLIFIFKESINNAVKYSNCENIYFNIKFDKLGIEFKIKDDGKGFDISNYVSGYGIKNIKERALIINSELLINTNKNTGTEITLIYKISSDNLIYNLN
ncbi:MAG TPA: two-component regulator propeller domain-containing protein [Ignavibacteria bacterium]|nr:two-component regulator propeller domain-containing protein [Ignavibacteria bacterium]